MARTLGPVKTPGHTHIRAHMWARTHGVAQHGHDTASPLTDTPTRPLGSGGSVKRPRNGTQETGLCPVTQNKQL